MSDQPDQPNASLAPIPVNHRVGGWLPWDQKVLDEYMRKLSDRVENDDRPFEQLDPTVVEFKKLVDGTPSLRMGFTEMFDEVPKKPPYNKDPTKKHLQIRSYEKMFRAFDLIISDAIPWDDNGVVICPINAILDWPMGTEAGLTTFLRPIVNEHFKKMFDVWAKLLTSKDSRKYLTKEKNGWFSPECVKLHYPDFDEEYKCKPNAEFHGFHSWDDFFTRRFRDGRRPVEHPEDDKIINAACESVYLRHRTNVKEHDCFWLKGSPYSIRDMLNNDTYTEKYVGGTVYQAFLSVYNFHRWVSPVNGIVDRFEIIPGTYYAESPLKGFKDPSGPDPSATDLSQAYITAIASRAIIWIDCDNPEVGKVGVLAVGMVEVSTCEVTVKKGRVVKKGDELGMFHFGGSTHCLLFEKGVEVDFYKKYIEPEAQGEDPPLTKLSVAMASIK